MNGMDLNLIKKTKDIVKIPIVYCGGIGSLEDIKKALKNDIAGVAGGSFFVFYGPHKAVLSHICEEIKFLIIKKFVQDVEDTTAEGIYFDENSICNY